MIESKKSYEDFYESIGDHDIIVDAASSDITGHAATRNPLACFVHDIKTRKTYTISFNHPDIEFKVNPKEFCQHINSLKNSIWALNKKDLIQILDIRKVHDISLLRFLADGSAPESQVEPVVYSFFRRMYKNTSNLGQIVPLLKHKEIFDDSIIDCIPTIKNAKIDDSYKKTNTLVVETLAELESNGICVDPIYFLKYFDAKLHKENMVYSQYNIYTATGRPSNRFDGVNYAALHKENGCRKSFVSRYGKGGKLVLIDYSAFHPRIICYLTNFDIPIEIDIYQYLAELYFNRKDFTPVDIDETKKLTFRQLYGGVEKQFEHIKYFNRLKEFVYKNWDFFKKNDYVATPIFHRKITTGHIHDPNPNKLFNYILQATEMEIVITILKEVNDFLREKKTKSVLYTYDSILFDFHREDGKQTLLEMVNIMKLGNKFPVKVYIGDNYHDMNQFLV